jgi:hypothetical protein
VNETIAALLKDGGIIAALVVVLLIVKALVPAFLRKNNHAKSPLMIASQPPRVATSGEQSTDFWDKRFDSLENELKTIKETLERMERKQ